MNMSKSSSTPKIIKTTSTLYIEMKCTTFVLFLFVCLHGDIFMTFLIFLIVINIFCPDIVLVESFFVILISYIYIYMCVCVRACIYLKKQQYCTKYCVIY